MEAVGALFALAVGLIATAAAAHGVQTTYDRGNLNRNSMVGIRTKVTMSSERAWSAGHRAAGPWLLAAARIGYSIGALTGALAVLQLVIGSAFPLALTIPALGFATVIAVLIIGARSANSAARSD